MKSAFAFVLVSLAAGVFAVAGSILGGSLLDQTGLFIGAILMGSVGVVLAGLLTRRLGWIEPPAFRMATTYGIIGFLGASALAVYGSRTFNNPIVPLLSVCLVGLGFLFGARRNHTGV